MLLSDGLRWKKYTAEDAVNFVMFDFEILRGIVSKAAKDFVVGRQSEPRTFSERQNQQ